MSLSAYQEKIVASRNQDESSILSVFKNIYTLMPELDFSFTNMYKELPIANNARLHAINEKSIDFKVSSLQLAAIRHCCKTLIQSPLLSACVIGKLTSLDTSSNIVSLGDFSYAEVLSDKRTTVRVKLNEPINALLSAGEHKFSGMICDISFGGCSFISAAGAVLEKAESLNLHLKMFQDNAIQHIKIPLSLLRKDCDASSNRYSAIFHHTDESDKFLWLFLFKHQQEIITELKEKKLPQGPLYYDNALAPADIIDTANRGTALVETGNQTILIIDDLPFNVAIMEAILCPIGFRTLKAFSGREGRILAVREQPSIILLDITMPGEDGVTTCRILKADPRTRDIPVIFLSALDGANDKASAFANGAVDYITKPFDRTEVLARVSSHLQTREKYAAAVYQQHQILDKLKRAQLGMLVKPEEMPQAAFSVFYRAVHSAGGDFYDVCPIGDDSFAYFVADISGHDLDASFNTSAIKALFQQSTGAGDPPEAVLRSINHGVKPLFYCNGMHMTACLVRLDRRAATATLTNAGHLPVIHLTFDGTVELIEAEGDILGVFDELVIKPVTKNVRRGDRLFIYTDGLVEQDGQSMDRHEGIEKLSSLCRETAALSLREAIPMICSSIFDINTAPGDDIILLGVEV
jgi:sigma-B regulation protein RsbU (phosphoserine phosphatase)